MVLLDVGGERNLSKTTIVSGAAERTPLRTHLVAWPNVDLLLGPIATRGHINEIDANFLLAKANLSAITSSRQAHK